MNGEEAMRTEMVPAADNCTSIRSGGECPWKLFDSQDLKGVMAVLGEVLVCADRMDCRYWRECECEASDQMAYPRASAAISML